MKTYFYLGKSRLSVDLKLENDPIIISFNYYKPAVDEVKAMKGAKWHADSRCWSVENCKRNLFAIRLLMKLDDYRLLPYKKDYKLALVPALPMWLHQVDMYQFASIRHRCIWAAEPRTGKTRPALQLFKDSKFNSCLFVTTNSATLGIMLEVQKWFSKEITLVEGYYRHKSTNKLIHLLTYEAFQKVDIEDCPGFIIFDELHKLKNESSRRTGFALELSESIEERFEGEEYVIGLTGTPAPRDPTDWWAQCEVIRYGWIREGSVKQFKSRYSNWSEDQSLPIYERNLGWNEEELKLLYRRLAPLVKVYLQKDVIDLPPIRWETCKAEPTKEMIRAAKVLARTVLNPLVLKNRLRQLSDGFSYTKDYDESKCSTTKGATEFFNSPKQSLLKNEFDNETSGRMVVYSAFQGSVDIVTKIALECGWSVLQIDGRGRKLFRWSNQLGSEKDYQVSERQEDILLALGQMDRSTNTGEIEKLVFNSQTDSGGTGLELSASSIIFYYSNSESGAGRMQSFRRCYSANMDTIRGLTVKDCFCLPTDELIKNQLDRKEELQSITMNDFSREVNKCLETFYPEEE